MKEFGFLYDSSMVAPKSDPPLWPFTLDFRIPHKCHGSRQRCPSRSFPGMWEMIMNPLDVEVNFILNFGNVFIIMIFNNVLIKFVMKGHICAMVDSCPTHLSDEEIYALLLDNFNRHYKSNRAPFGLYFHTIWFKEKRNFNILMRFIDELIGNKVVLNLFITLLNLLLK